MLKPFYQRVAPLAAFTVSLAALPLLLRITGTEYYAVQLTMALYYAIVVAGLCLVMGHAGQLSLGHGAFFAIGGYTAAFLTTYDFSSAQTAAWARVLHAMGGFVNRQNLYGNEITTASPWLAFVIALVTTVSLACVIGYPALRLKGYYLAMATLGFGLIVHKMILGSAALGATDGITSVPDWRLAPGLEIMAKRSVRISNYYVACGLLLLVLTLISNLLRSRVGRALQAIHDRETAANAMGIDTAAVKLTAFVFSAGLAATAGVFFTHYTGGIGPSEASALKSIRYVALAAAGGMANLWGVTLASIVLNFLSLRGVFGTYDHAVFGAILIGVVTLAPDGPLKPVAMALRRLFCRGQNARAAHISGPVPNRSISVRTSDGLDQLQSASTLSAASTRFRSQSSMRASGPAQISASDWLLEVSDVTRRFGGLVAVNHVSFGIKPGQIKALIGPNGAGKTTLFNIISGVIPPDSGEIRLRNQTINGRKPYQIASAGVSRTFQNPSLFLKMTVLENVMIGRHSRSHCGFIKSGVRFPAQIREERAIRRDAMVYLEALDLAHLAALSAGALAFGQRRMVELARALATMPSLLLLDEPASGLNTSEKLELAELIRHIRDKAGVTVLLVEHDMSLVMGLSDEVLVLHNGTRIAEGTPSVIQNDAKVISVYLGGQFQHAATSH